MRKIAVMILALSVVMTSCQTIKTEPAVVPEIDYPEFPVDVDDSSVSISLSGEMVCIDYTADGRKVEIPLWFWLSLVEYSINVDSAVKQYQAVIESINK